MCYSAHCISFSQHYISFFHVLVNGLSVTCFRTFGGDPVPSFYIGGRGKIKMVSASISTNEPAKYLILVHTVQLKPMIKAQISGRVVSNGYK